MLDLSSAAKAAEELSDVLWSIVCPRCGCLHEAGECCVSKEDSDA